MTAKLWALGAGVVVALAVFLLPAGADLAAAAGGAVVAFGWYALRERAALRALSGPLRRLTERERSQDEVLAAIQAVLDDETDRHGELREALDRLRGMGFEMAALHAATTTEVLSRLDDQRTRLDARLDESDQAIGDRVARAEHLLGHAATQAEVHRLHTEELLAASRDFRQVEALVGLHSLIQVRAPLPPSRKWAASPDLVLYLTSLILERRPRVVVELGSGLSTVWLGYAMERAGHDGSVLSLENDTGFLASTRALLAAHGLAGRVDVRHAPLTDVELDGEVWPWYDPAALADVRDCALLFVDGPEAATGKQARYPALPLLADRLAADAMVVLDDCVRSDEQDIVARWRERFPTWTVRMVEHEKITAVFSSGGAAQ